MPDSVFARISAAKPRALVVIGAAPVEADNVIRLLSTLPSDLPAAVLVAMFNLRRAESLALMSLLDASLAGRCGFACDRQEIASGCVYVAPSDRHLVVEREHMRVVFGPKQNMHRPSLDPFFRTAALSWGEQVIGISLCGVTGAIDDGLVGLHYVKERGGTVILPHAEGAAPVNTTQGNVFERISADYAPPLPELPGVLTQLVSSKATTQ